VRSSRRTSRRARDSTTSRTSRWPR
jgi:hypothetical protein